jgi:hypothetical protein
MWSLYTFLSLLLTNITLIWSPQSHSSSIQGFSQIWPALSQFSMPYSSQFCLFLKWCQFHLLLLPKRILSKNPGLAHFQIVTRKLLLTWSFSWWAKTLLWISREQETGGTLYRTTQICFIEMVFFWCSRSRWSPTVSLLMRRVSPIQMKLYRILKRDQLCPPED